MTAKRFTIKPSMIVDDVTVIIDNQKEYTFPVLDSTLNYMFCKVLNEQHKTIQKLNQQLRIFSDGLKAEIRETKEVFEDYSECVDEKKQLKEENEQLKSENKKLNERIGILEGSLIDKGFDIND